MMADKIFKIIVMIVVLFALLQGGSVFAKTTIDFTDTTGTGADDIDYTDAENAIQERSDLNGPIIADAFALANIMGYPIGKSSIGGFPHFEAGLAVGAGFTNTVYYSDDEDAPEGSFPGIMANPVIHMGFGLARGFDVIGKLFYFNLNAYDPNLESSTATLKELNMLSVGGKIRYNYIEDKTVIPFLLSFGGLTFSLGADVMIGKIGITGNYETDLDDITVTEGGTDYTVSTHFDGDYDAAINWKIISLTAQAVSYIDIMYLFSFYTGFGLTGNLGFFNTDFDGTGILTTPDDPPASSFTPAGQIGTLEFTSTNSYRPVYFIPTWIFGLELNLTVLKITGETMVNLRNGEDVTLQAGVRIQI